MRRFKDASIIRECFAKIMEIVCTWGTMAGSVGRFSVSVQCIHDSFIRLFLSLFSFCQSRRVRQRDRALDNDDDDDATHHTYILLCYQPTQWHRIIIIHASWYNSTPALLLCNVSHLYYLFHAPAFVSLSNTHLLIIHV